MRILTLGHSYVVAMNRRLAHEWAEAGHEVTVAAPMFYHADLKPMSCEESSGEPFRLARISTRGSRRVHIFQYGSELKQLMRTGGFDIVHAWEEPFIYAGFQIARWCPRKTPLVFSTFQNLPKRYPPPFSWFERYCLNRAAGWTAFGQTIAENHSHHDIYHARPWQMIPLGVDTNAFHPDRSLKSKALQSIGFAENGPPVIGYVGRFVPEKGIPFLLDVLNRLEDPGKRWRVVFIGGGPLENHLGQWSARFGLGTAQVITGIEHARVPEILNALDLCVVPSETTPRWKEQLGRILLEAMASGVPVIANKSGEIPYVVDKAGILCRERNFNDWLDAFNQLLDDPDLRHNYSKKGLAHTHLQYAWPLVANRFIEFFRTVIEK